MPAEPLLSRLAVTNRGLRAGRLVIVRILIVEDEVSMARSLARGLAQEGYTVDVAFDGAGRSGSGQSRSPTTPSSWT